MTSARLGIFRCNVIYMPGSPPVVFAMLQSVKKSRIVFGGHFGNGRHFLLQRESAMSLYPKFFLKASTNCVPNFMLVSQFFQLLHISAALL